MSESVLGCDDLIVWRYNCTLRCHDTVVSYVLQAPLNCSPQLRRKPGVTGWMSRPSSPEGNPGDNRVTGHCLGRWRKFCLPPYYYILVPQRESLLCHLLSHSAPNMCCSGDISSCSRSPALGSPPSAKPCHVDLPAPFRSAAILHRSIGCRSATFCPWPGAHLGMARNMFLENVPSGSALPTNYRLMQVLSTLVCILSKIPSFRKWRGIARAILESLWNTALPTQLKGSHIFKQDLGSLLTMSLHDNAIVS